MDQTTIKDQATSKEQSAGVDQSAVLDQVDLKDSADEHYKLPEGFNAPANGHALRVDFSYKSWKCNVSNMADETEKPIYTNSLNLITGKMTFKRTADDSTFSTGRLPLVSINPSLDVNGKATKLHALSRFRTRYTHLSHALSKTGEPVPVTWATTASLKKWDFIILDEQQNPVARFSANVWGVRKIGSIEFMSEEPPSEALKEEFVATAITLFYTMIVRMYNIFQLIGAVAARPSKVPTVESTKKVDGAAGAA